MLNKMTEASVEGIIPVLPELRSDSRLIVLHGTPDGIKVVSKKLQSLQGVTRIRNGLFIVQGYSKTHESALQSQLVLSFIRTREIPTSRVKMEDAFSNRVYSIVAFRFKNPTAQQKKQVERLIKRSTGIRLRPGVILFPLLRSKERRRILGSEEERVLIDSTEFNRRVRDIGGTSGRWSRLKIISLDGDKHIRYAVEQSLYRNLNLLEEKIRALREQCKDSSVTISQLKKNFSILSRSFRESKTKWMLAKKVWSYDAEKALKRTYNMLINTRREIKSTETKRLS